MNGSRIAIIYDSHHYDLMMMSLRANMPTGMTRMLVWTGIEIDPKTGVTTSRDGVPYVRWFGTEPSSLASRTQVGLKILSDEDDNSQGMFNASPTGSQLHGVICEISD